MASIQEPEVQFAQRLASNEKPVRTRAIKKLRKYINVRSQKATGGFTGDELLKLWKGLFYCLWMQDKPLLQEELSNQISSLIHSFHDLNGQLLYLEGFLQTFKREWTGIDRLRMDKFFQLIRFMFRQTFEMLKRNNWQSSVVERFLELVTVQLLQSSSRAPIGLQFHILDLYMTELAAVGSEELTADQNLIFIEPFCKTAAKTKDRNLFSAICSSIFSTIIDQAPFAIEDLMREVKAAEDSDSCEASEEGEHQLKENMSKSSIKKGRAKLVNGGKLNEKEEEEEDEDDEDEDGSDLGPLEDSDTELTHDDDVGPVLQFDYAALADKLFELASRSSTPSHNTQKLYRIIKVLRDLNEGIFPQDEYPEEVSTDEDDDMFGSRKRMKRSKPHMEEDEEGAPGAKKSKGKKRDTSIPNKQKKVFGKEDNQGDISTNDKKMKKRRKKKAGQGQSVDDEEGTEKSEQGQTVPQNIVNNTKGGLECSHKKSQSSISSVKVTEAVRRLSQSKSVLTSELKKQPAVTVIKDKSCNNENHDQSETFSNKKKKRDTFEPKTLVTIVKQQTTTTTEPEMPLEATAPVSVKKKKRKSLRAESQTDAGAEIAPVSCEESQEKSTTTAPAKKKKSLRAEKKPAETEGKSRASDLSERKGKQKEKEGTHGTSEDTTLVAAADDSIFTPLKKKMKKNQKDITAREKQAVTEIPRVLDAEKLLFEITMTTPAKMKKKSLELSPIQTQLQMVSSVDAELPLDETDVAPSSEKPTKKKKKKKIPVVFEFEANELETVAEKEASARKTTVENDVTKPPTPLNVTKSRKKAKTSLGSASDFITFQANKAVPAPLFCKTKGSPRSPLTSEKKSHTPISESKKVTFGLKNNKTAEFRKTDRSLLVSPDGSSRVPFDPRQKPKFGVLKSPPTPFPKAKMSLNTLKSSHKRRPSAADYF
ncbi:hypothetical protein Q5P01_013131 [Channa striata]|uniref:Uncharacterized protein n=1 Tax=Channa striata TaxID=64152 RepID=A0AA88MK09_CHASR|nr:hypothetical protein Q5P01_013131 [Channa striata]